MAPDKLPDASQLPRAPRLTERCRAAGCAAKLGPADLKGVLEQLKLPTHPDLLVGIATGDDAGVYRLRSDLAIVNTVDFFTPVVDDPFTFGQISATNALSDVYAMGGIPHTALNIVCWPQQGMPPEMLLEILRGGAAKAEEAGVVVVGGHSVADEEVKYGMAITGVIDPRRVLRNVGARPGDSLILTKPLGTGVLLTAFKRERLEAEHYAAAVKSMCTLNLAASQAMLRHNVHAVTDVTGFGLAGHALGMAEGSGVTLRFEESDLPLLPGALEAWRGGFIPSGGQRNREYYGPRVAIGEEVAEPMAGLAFDPQTSGGLLIALPAREALGLLAELQQGGNLDAALVGQVVAQRDFALELV